MEEKRISIIPIALVFAIIAELMISLFTSNMMMDAVVQGGNLLGIHTENAKEYPARFDRYESQELYSMEGGAYSKSVAVVICELPDGQTYEVYSNLTNDERGSTLPANVTVLDNGSRFWIKQDLDAMHHNAMRGIIIVAVKGAIWLIFIIICVVTVKRRKRAQTNTDW